MTSFPPSSTSLSGRALLSRAASVSPEPTLLLDDQCRVVSVNPAAQTLLCGAAEIPAGQEVSALCHPDDRLPLEDFLRRNHAAGGEGVGNEAVQVRVRQAGGEWLWVSAASVSFLNDPNVEATVLHLRPQQLQEQQHSALWEIARLLNSTQNFSEVINEVLTWGLQAIGTEAESVFLLSEAGQHLRLIGQTGFSAEAVAPWAQLPLTLRTPVTDVARDRQPLFLSNQEYQLQYPHLRHTSSFASFGFAALPLLVGDQLLGVLALCFSKDHAFSRQQQTFLQLVAGLCAPALDRCLLSEQLKRQQDWSVAVNLNSSDIATVLDDQSVIRYESGSIERVLGYSATELLGQSVFSLIHPDDQAQVQAALAGLSAGGPPLTETFRFRHRDGRWVWLESVAVDLSGHPHVGGVLVNSRDVTLREEARAAQQEVLDRLSASEHDFRRLADHSSDLVRQYDLDGTVVYVSPTARDLLGYDRADLLGADPLRHVHRHDLPALRAAFLRRFTPLFEQEKFEYRLRRRDGTYVWVETVFKAVRDPGTQTVTAFIGTSRDIDQRKRAEQHLQVQLDRYRHLLDFTASLELLRDPASLTAEALHRSLELTEYDYGYAFACTDSGLTLEAQAGRTSAAVGSFMDELLAHTFAPVIAQAIQRGETSFMLDDQSFLDPPEQLPRLHWRSLCVLPILRQGVVMGLLVFGNSGRVACSEDTRQLLQNVAARLSHALERQDYLDQLNTSREETLRALGLALEYRDYETKGHTDRVVLLTERLGRALNFPPADQDALRWGAFLHDTGKVAIPDDILLKPGKLTPEEWDFIRRHPTIGYEMLHHIPSLPPATLEVVLYHQERWDGSGYPDGLQGQQIPLSARVFAVVDVYDALTSLRPYKRAWSHQEAAEQLQIEAGVLLDRMVVRTFLNLFHSDGSFKADGSFNSVSDDHPSSFRPHEVNHDLS
jgi:PAS domain S-box-containing protein